VIFCKHLATQLHLTPTDVIDVMNKFTDTLDGENSGGGIGSNPKGGNTPAPPDYVATPKAVHSAL
jgi:hypothetical protein